MNAMLAVVLLLVAGYALACYFTGENLLAAWWDEWRLGRVPLAEWEIGRAHV